MSHATDYADFDEVVVHRLVAGHRAGEPIRAADAGEATRRLAAQGYSDGQIAVRLGFRRRSVIRIRARLRIPAGVPLGSIPTYPATDVPARPRAEG